MTCCQFPRDHGDRPCPAERAERAVAWALAEFTWTVTFPDLPVAEFERVAEWIASHDRGAQWGKWTLRHDSRVSAAAVHGTGFDRLAELVALVEDWHAWCGASVRVPPLPYGSRRWRRLAEYVATYDPAAEAVQATVAFALNPDENGCDNATTLLFIDGHLASEVVAILDPGLDEGVVPF